MDSVVALLTSNVLQAPLRQFTATDWSSALDTLLPEVHDVDRDAVRIWLAFFPIALADAFESAPDEQAVTRRLRIDGNPRLAGQIDSSHRFLYGHRYWPIVKTTIARAPGAGVSEGASLTAVVRKTIADVSASARADARLVAGITFVGLMTLRQIGLDAFRAASSESPAAPAPFGKSPDAVIARRARDDRQGLLGFLRRTKRFSVVFDERVADASFPLLDSQHLTTASAADGRDYMRGPRRFQEGPIPAQCRSATCGTCWVGVLGGREKLSEIEPYETRRLREFGYADASETRPIIRLACQARASGNVTIVIPPWHGFVSRLETPGQGVPAGAGT